MPGDVDTAAKEAELGAHLVTLDKFRPIRGGLTTWIFRGGFVVHERKRGSLDVYPWVKCHIKYSRTNVKAAAVVTLRTEENVTARHENGSEFTVFGTDNPHVGTFLKIAEAAITASQFILAWDALKRRERLDFGPIQLDLEALHCKGNSIPWHEARFSVYQGNVSISRRGKWRSHTAGCRGRERGRPSNRSRRGS